MPMVCCTDRSGLELVLGPVDVEHGRELDEQAPPRPLPDRHELPHILLQAPDGDILHLRKNWRYLNRSRLERFSKSDKKISFSKRARLLVAL
jgi:hypothetical protein